MLVRRKVSNEPSVEQLPGVHDENSTLRSILQFGCVERNRSAVSNTYFSLGWPGQAIAGHRLLRAADVIHLHWVADFQSPGSVAQLQQLGKPLVWTLRDQRPFTGGCHFSAGCTQYERDCLDCPQLARDPCHLTAASLGDARELLSPEAFCVVGPSHWMADCARRSALFSRSRVEVIPNGMETDRFQALEQTQARQALGLPVDGVRLLFGADYGNERRKGFPELAAALERCGQDTRFSGAVKAGQVSLLCFGRPHELTEKIPIPVESFGLVQSDKKLNQIYAAADLFVLPSLEDNFPGTALEAMSSGTPVLAFRIGGVPDVVVEGQTGCMVPHDAGKLGEVILSLISNPGRFRAMRSRCREHVLRNFTAKAGAEQYRVLYRDLLAPRRRIGNGASGPVSLGFTDGGPRLRRSFHCLLTQCLAGAADLLPPSPDPSADEQVRRSQLTAHLAEVLKTPGAASFGYGQLRKRIDPGLQLFAGIPRWRGRLRALLRNVLRR